MYPQDISESDWKLFRVRLPQWQERYMESLVQEYIRLLNSPENASDKFWELEKRIRKDQRRVGVVADVRRSMMHMNMVALLEEKAITVDDLDGFSDEMREFLYRVAGPSHKK